MNTTEAARLLDLSPDASAEQLETRFLELRTKLEDKIAKAPTPGLKAKYRASLADITTAFEMLTLAADGDSLPVLDRVTPTAQPKASAASGASASPAPASPKPSASPKPKGNREFLVVAFIAVLILVGGGWWIVQTRAANAERARIAAEAQSEAERVAAERQQREAEEKMRHEAEFARLRASQAELKIRWEVIEREGGAAERRLSELRSDIRSAERLPAPDQAELKARFDAQTDFVNWLQPTLARHPARALLARFDALLSTKALAEAAVTERELVEALAKLDAELPEQRDSLLTLTARVEISSDPVGQRYRITDAYGRTHESATPFRAELPLGRLEVHISAPIGWRDSAQIVAVKREKPLLIAATLEAVPEGEPIKLGETRSVDGLGLTLIGITVGRYQRGSATGEADEKPVHTVVFSRGYWLGKTEVTQAQWQSIMGSNPSYYKGADRPVEAVSWEDAMAFCRRLTERERAAGRLPAGFAYTLPTEAQWEYACRAGTTGDHAGNLDEVAWYKENSDGQTQPVGRKQANAWGFQDMHGNVWEWCLDWYGGYPSGTVTDPAGPESGSSRVSRGGGFSSRATSCRSAFRFGYSGGRNGSLGFRLALSSVR